MAGNTVKEMTTNFGKLDKFEGLDFRRWQKKMHFLLTMMKVVYVLTTPMPELLENATVEAIRIRAKCENDDYICRGHILNGMSDSLFDVYMNVESAKELWDSLESKYMAEDSSSKKFLYIDKLPPSWKDFKHTLKHGKDDLSLVQLSSYLRIEESLRAQDSDKGKGKEVAGPSVNMTEEGKNKNNKQNKGKKRDFNMKHPVDAIAWWIDSGATTHVCKDRCWCKTYEPVEDGSVLYMGDDHFSPVYGKGSVCGYKQVYESDKYILSKCGVFVGFGYYNNGLSEGFWDEAMLTACYLLNRVPNKRNKTTPYELWYKKRPNLVFLRVWGCRAIVRIPDPKRKTLGEKGIDCIYVGYVPAYQWHIVANGSFKKEMKVNLEPIDKFKARLVIQGFRQKEGIDYFDTYAPVARITTIRLLCYEAPLEGFVMPGNEHKVCKLVKSLYGLKQAPKQWHQKFDEVVLSSGFLLNQSDKCVYSKFDSSVLNERYGRILMYAMTSTRPDIAYAVGRLSRFTSNPSRQHWQAITRVFKYLKGTMNYGLSYMGYPSVLEGYSDASWINHVEDSSSTSGWVFLLGGGAISWASKKQTCITGSTMESEFVALAAAGKEAEWLRNLIHEIPIWPKPIAPISIRCDSAPTMAKAYSQIYNGKSRHLGVRHSMIRELIMNGVISIEFVRSQKNLADHLTKGLARDLVNKSVIGMGLKSI
ncbi:zinc finger, CCHC-type containing protein [Tanacetum coccineum]